MQKEFTDVFVFVSARQDGTEGIITFGSPIGPLPMIYRDMEKVMEGIPLARAEALRSRQPFRILKIVNPVDVTKEVLREHANQPFGLLE